MPLPLSPEGFGAAGRILMKDEGRAAGGLDPVHDRAPPERARWGRRSPYGFPRHDGAQGGVHQFGPTYAALDLGTNNCRLLVARPIGDSFRVIDAFSRIIRLGEGLSTSGRISEAAIDRAVAALGICRDKMRNRGVTRARLIAPEACRAAANGARTPTLRPRSACCARAASGQAAAPPRSVMNSRRFIRSPR